MAKELPYFKFFVSEWNDGDITLEDYEVQGLFINVCSYYWSNECTLTLKKAEKKFRNADSDLWQTLINEQLIKVDKEDYISISFLDEQAQERGKLCSTNAGNAKKGWEKRKAEAKAKQELSEKDATALKSQSETDAKGMQYREEEKREEKKREEEDINFLISLYPDTCEGRNCSTRKGGDSIKAKLKKILGKKSKEQVEASIKGYVSDCAKSKTYLLNFSKFLDELPEAVERIDPNKLDDDYIYYQWMNDPTVIARRIPKDLADQMFKNQAQASLIPTILTSLKGKKITWTQ
tara:strand:+ start:111 stop:986 length:876 start_codon:yes stop_codon:yes gene_type:complete